MKTSRTILCSCALVALLTSCKKDRIESGPSASTPYYVRMTDAPAAYKAVNVDVQAVEITGQGTVHQTNMNPGIYNLLNFSNGIDTLVASFQLSMPRVEQIRLILGPNNSIVTTDNVSHPLSTPSAQQSGLKIQVHQAIQPGVPYSILLDFDAEQSIVDEGNGNFSLKPVIKIKSASTCTDCL
jgi:hypothetical protein